MCVPNVPTFECSTPLWCLAWNCRRILCVGNVANLQTLVWICQDKQYCGHFDSLWWLSTVPYSLYRQVRLSDKCFAHPWSRLIFRRYFSACKFHRLDFSEQVTMSIWLWLILRWVTQEWRIWRQLGLHLPSQRMIKLDSSWATQRPCHLWLYHCNSLV